MTNDRSKSSVAARSDGSLTSTSASELDTFLAEIRQAAAPSTVGRGRLIFALDATASRQSTWDTAAHLQGEMFHTVAAVGSLDMQLVYYRGLSECRASKWIPHPEQMGKTMSQIICNAGETQIEKILIHAKKETKLLRVSALVFVGDAIEENPDVVVHEAGELGRLGVPAFMFQEGRDPVAEQTFRDVARVSSSAIRRSRTSTKPRQC